ncbi:MAG: putative Ig domain-containing protein [Dehalococcoidales bacterium]|nr:putative Ig domain-containing protein [Dehalococcoidales bacterium]
MNGYLSSLGTSENVLVSFEYGTTTSYGNTTASQSMSTPGAFNANITGLAPGTVYHFRAKATGTTTVYGSDMTFTTLPINRAPVLNPIGNKTVKEMSTLTFTLSATDPDGDPLTFSASNLPPGASFNPVTRTFTWTPTYWQSGVYSNIRFQVSDGSLIDYEYITITVRNVRFRF